MSITWQGGAPPPAPRIGMLGWIRAGVKGAMLIVVVFIGLLGVLLLRLIERPIWRQARPLTAAIPVWVCRLILSIIGLRVDRVGHPMPGQGAIVANHSSWLDIIVLNAGSRIYFVSKAEVARWPGIGWLARATGTVFIERTRSRAADQSRVFQERLKAGHRLLFFPEGTSSDGLQVLPFKTSLFAAFFTPDLSDLMSVQPVSVFYAAPAGADPRFYGWWGNMELGSHLLQLLSSPKQGSVTVRYAPPSRVAQATDRKTLAADCEAKVRSGHDAGQAPRPSM